MTSNTSSTFSMPRASVLRNSALLLCALALGGCSTIKGWFGGGKDDSKPNEPVELTDFTPSVTVAKVWSAQAGKGEGRVCSPGADRGRWPRLRSCR